MQRLQKPTLAIVNQYVQRFDDGEAGDADKALTELLRVFPQNVQLEHVLVKVAALNSLYNTNIMAVVPVATYIWRLNIDAKLAQRAPELVNEITPTPVREGKIRQNYSFATKYCSWHMPDGYPIFDGFVEKLLCEYQRFDEFSDFERSDFRDYPRFKSIIEEFREYYELTDCNFKDLDKFLWLYGKEYFDKTS